MPEGTQLTPFNPLETGLTPEHVANEGDHVRLWKDVEDEVTLATQTFQTRRSCSRN